MTRPTAEQMDANRAKVQDQLDRHMISDTGGQCEACQQLAPCDSRSAAYRVFLALGQLPRREPGRWAFRFTHRAISAGGR